MSVLSRILYSWKSGKILAGKPRKDSCLIFKIRKNLGWPIKKTKNLERMMARTSTNVIPQRPTWAENWFWLCRIWTMVNIVFYSQFFSRKKKKLIWRSEDNEKTKILYRFQNLPVYHKKLWCSSILNFLSKICVETYKTIFIIILVCSIQPSTKKRQKIAMILNFRHLILDTTKIDLYCKFGYLEFCLL